MKDATHELVARLAFADRVRGVAILLVMAFHYIVLRETLDDPWIAALAHAGWLDALLHQAWIGVDLFFVLSGFLLSIPWHLHARGELARPGVRAFYRRRFWRIAPAYYVQLAFLFGLVMPLLGGRDFIRADVYVIGANVVAHSLLVQSLTPLTIASLGFNGALWTLSIEMQFYLLLPLAALACARRPVLAFVIACAITLAWRCQCAPGFDALVSAIRVAGSHWHWSDELVRGFLRPQLPSYLAHFALGMLLASIWIENQGRSRISRQGPGHMAKATEIRLRPWFSSPGLLQRIGRVSYSAYLYHVPLLLLIGRAGVAGAIALPLYVALVFGIASISWRYLEPPFAGWHARTKPVGSAEATALAAERSAGP